MRFLAPAVAIWIFAFLAGLASTLPLSDEKPELRADVGNEARWESGQLAQPAR